MAKHTHCHLIRQKIQWTLTGCWILRDGMANVVCIRVISMIMRYVSSWYWALPTESLQIKDPFIRSFCKEKLGGYAGLKKYAAHTEDHELVGKLSVVEKYNKRIPELVDQLYSRAQSKPNCAGQSNEKWWSSTFVDYVRFPQTSLKWKSSGGCLTRVQCLRYLVLHWFDFFFYIYRIRQTSSSRLCFVDYILGTVHKSKGLEFDTVVVMDDFIKVPCSRHNLQRMNINPGSYFYFICVCVSY